MPNVLRRGMRIHFDVIEPARPTSRPPVALIHGLGLSSRFWFDMPHRLANDPQCPRRVITIDNRGTGQSDIPRWPHTLRAMADDARAVLDAAGAAQADVVGISLGGMIALQLAVHHPSHVHGLVLMATTAGFPFIRYPGLGAMIALLATPWVRGKRIRSVDRLLLPEREIDRAKEHFAAWPAAFRLDPVHKRTFWLQIGAQFTHSVGWSLPKISCPTVVVSGTDDILVPPRNAQILARRIPSADLMMLKDVAHAIPVLAPNVVHDALLRIDEKAGLS